MASSKLTDDQIEATRAVLFFFGHPKGWESGGFLMSLIEVYSRADLTNKAKLRLGFPEVGEAFDLVNNNHGGLDMLAERV